MWGAFWNSIQEEVWGTEHSGTKGGQVAEDGRRQRKLFGKRLEGWPEPSQVQAQYKEGFVAARELSGPEVVTSYHSAFNRQDLV